MKTLDPKSLMVGALLTMIAVGGTLIATGDNAPPAWDYKLVRGFMGTDFEDKLKAAARDGWEVVSASDSQSGPFAVVRKPKAIQRPAWWKFWKK